MKGERTNMQDLPELHVTLNEAKLGCLLGGLFTVTVTEATDAAVLTTRMPNQTVAKGDHERQAAAESLRASAGHGRRRKAPM